MSRSGNISFKSGIAGKHALFILVMGGFLALCLKGGWTDVFKSHLLPGIPGGVFILLYSATWLAMLGLFLFFPRNLTARKGAVIILLLGLVCRLVLLPHAHSDDVNRYLWEGRLISENINPYQYPPDHHTLKPLAGDDPYHALINHPENPAAYPPLSLYIFSLAGQISYTPVFLKIIMLLFDLGTAGFVLLLLSKRRLDLRWGILYAFNPLILYSFAGQGHFDAIHLFFLTGAFFFYDRKSWKWMFLFIGLAVQIKYVALLGLPFLVNKHNYKLAWISGAAIILPYVPLLDGHWPQLFFSIIKFGEEYAFNGSVHGLLRAASGDMNFATLLVKILLPPVLLFGYWYFHPGRDRFKNDPVPGAFFVYGALLLFAPTVHFWYVSWIVPFIALHFKVSWLVLTLTMGGYFAVYPIQAQTGQWMLPVWARIFEWLPFYMLLAFDLHWAVSKRGAPEYGEPVRTLSVIVPTLNEEKTITQCIRTIQKDPSVSEIWVVDGGSTDRTVETSEKMKVKTIRHLNPVEKGGGRGGQIKKGLHVSTGDVVAVVHADVVAEGSEFTKILEILNRNRLIIGGAVGGQFSSKDPGMKLIEYANDFRAAMMDISFGDQIQFFRRSPVIMKNLYPGIPLMEDVELSLRLKKLGRLVYLFGNASVSTRRWEQMGRDNLTAILKRVFKYLWNRVWTSPDTFNLYQDYYCNIGKRKETEWTPTIHRRICQNLKK